MKIVKKSKLFPFFKKRKNISFSEIFSFFRETSLTPRSEPLHLRKRAYFSSLFHDSFVLAGEVTNKLWLVHTADHHERHKGAQDKCHGPAVNKADHNAHAQVGQHLQNEAEANPGGVLHCRRLDSELERQHADIVLFVVEPSNVLGEHWLEGFGAQTLGEVFARDGKHASLSRHVNKQLEIIIAFSEVSIDY